MDLQESNKLINTYLVDLYRKPVGVKFIKTKEEFDKLDVAERDTKVAYCNAVNLASRGHGLKMRSAHHACFNGKVALGFDKYPEPMTSGKGRVKKGIYENVETSKGVSDDMDKTFYHEDNYGIVIQPLDECKEDPDVVIVVGKSYNIMRIIQGYGYKHGYAPSIKTVGLQAVCHDLTTAPLVNDSINITFLCPGTRHVADWEVDELGVGVSFNKWYDTVEGVVATTNPFVRNPLKKEIIKKLDEQGMDSSHIILNQNYDTGTYTGGKVENID